MMMRRNFVVCGILCFALFAEAATVRAALDMTATGVYDEQTSQLNTIDSTPTPGTSSGTVSLVTLADFKSRITSAFAGGTGGVISFDDFGTAQALTNEMKVGYASGTKTLTVSTTAGNKYQIDMGSLTAVGATPISGNNYLRSGDPTHIFNFDTPLSDLGVTILGRNTTRSVTATVGYSDGTTGVLNALTIAASGVAAPPSATSAGDAFLGFTAPLGKAITSLTLVGNDYFVVDDIGFVTSAIPEPSSIALLATLAVGSLWGLRRRLAR